MSPGVSAAGVPAPQVVILMGVAGSGKTTIGLRLAAALGWAFHDADGFHPPANIAKMSAGIPLDDADRAPWLAAIRACALSPGAISRGAVIACSALKESHRGFLSAPPARVRFVHLTGSYELILGRIRAREGHFMKDSMLASQFDALEPPGDAIAIDVAAPPDAIVARIIAALPPAAG
jgi:gluconokinase